MRRDIPLEKIPYRYHELPVIWVDGDEWSPEPFPGSERRVLWACVVCGRQDVWSKEWQRFGSLLMDDCGGCEYAVCSNACRARIEAEE